MNKCKKCGFKFEGKFCPECGTKFDGNFLSSVILNDADVTMMSEEETKFSNGLEFHKTEDGYKVSGIGVCKDSHLIIPSVHNDKPVVSIGVEAFRSCMFIKSVTVAPSIKNIADNAFWECKSLRNIELPYGLTSVGVDAFNDCKALVSISVPDTVRKIGDGAFCGCSSLESIKLPKSISSIGDVVFNECSSLKLITIPDEVISIGRGTFDGCKSLESMVIPSSLASVDLNAFAGCKRLKVIYYTGDEVDWTVISVKSGNKAFTSTKRFYYSRKGTSESGKSWRYNEDGMIVVW